MEVDTCYSQSNKKNLIQRVHSVNIDSSDDKITNIIIMKMLKVLYTCHNHHRSLTWNMYIKSVHQNVIQWNLFISWLIL